MTSVIIPAHNEQAGIPRLLAALLSSAGPAELEIVVVCNGCTDATAAQARTFGAQVQVVEIEQPSKAAALRRGDEVATTFPRLYVDADVVLGTQDVRDLVKTLTESRLLATSPTRRTVRTGLSRAARWYYAVWERLPQVRTGLFGRGVIAVSEEGFRRIAELPRVMADDLAFSESFSPTERAITASAEVLVFPARTWRALVERRVRVAIGNQQLRDAGLSTPAAGTSVADLARIVRSEPRLAAGVALFAATAAYARAAGRRRARRGPVAWVRDETSRSGG